MGCLTSPSKSLKWFCAVVAVILIVELLVFNYLILYGYLALRQSVGSLSHLGQADWVDRVQRVGWVRGVVDAGKSGGFVGALQNSLERLYIVLPSSRHDPDLPQIGTFRLDVSHSGEFLFIYNHMLSHRDLRFSKLVIDVGANDGLLSSNSFNLIQMGWSAILIEPLQDQAKLAKVNLDRYVNPYKESNQTVKVIQAVLSDKDGSVQFAVADDIAGMEGYVIPKELDGYEVVHHRRITVASLTVKTFTYKYAVPKYFGLLSIDAEGAGKILHEFIGLGFRPAYIIYEDIHERSMEHPDQTKEFLTQNGYTYLTRRGWNLIFVYRKHHR
ncbi:hypothetical protein FSP39_023644 [Pinctada imbricata]|uniref:Methyltransferase FkbM domain-containing protein n=1 Tax=Pinctada imbricata TaxID=66713 RepID=A0AA88XGT2_PINIB|nr:hypothetical protein FSP39_023644 [Pinctada imbricata]